MEINYAGNSYKSKEEKKEREPREKVVKGTVSVKKKSGFSKFFSDFLNGDMQSVKEYLIEEVLLPSVKSTLSDAISNGADMLLYGESRGSRNRYSSSGPKVSYNSIYNKDPRNKVTKLEDRKSRASVDDIILESRAEAEEVISQLRDIIDDYGLASVADLYDLVGIETSYTDNKYGWYELNAGITRVREGYLVKVGKPVVLD